MGYKISRMGIQETLEAGQRLSRPQVAYLIQELTDVEKRLTAARCHIDRLNEAVRSQQQRHVEDSKQYTLLAQKYNALIGMLNAFLGRTIVEDERGVVALYREALEKKVRHALYRKNT